MGKESKGKYQLDPNHIDADESDYLYVKESQLSNAGNGLFTAITILKDEIIAIYGGEILSAADARLKAEQRQDRYFINLPNGSILDSMYSDCFARFANDAVGISPSVINNNSKISLDDSGNVCLVATRRIKQGEEIYCDYGKKYWLLHQEGRG